MVSFVILLVARTARIAWRTDRQTDRQTDRGMGRISYNGALCIGNLNRMGRIDGAKWVGLHFFTKLIFILSDYSLDYKSRLVSLDLLPISMTLELNDIIFFLRSLKSPSTSFNILNFVSFCDSSTRSSAANKLKHPIVYSTSSCHFYFNRLPRLWNSLPVMSVDAPLSVTITHLKRHFFSYCTANFNPSVPCSFHLFCPCPSCFSSCSSNFTYYTAT